MKTALLFLLVMLNFIVMKNITVSAVSIESFFPSGSSVSGVSFMENHQRMLFTSGANANVVNELLEEGKIKDSIKVADNTLMILYAQSELRSLFEHLSLEELLGPPVVGQILSKEFVSDMRSYFYFVLPLLGLLFLALTSLKYLYSILVEMLLFSFTLLGIIALFSLVMNISFLLSLVFIYIYGFTILNYFYYGQIQKQSLYKGIVVSLATTMLSGLFLSQSHFPIISDFGNSLLIWIGVLGVYLMARSVALPLRNWNLKWLDHLSRQVDMSKYIVVFFLILTALLLFRGYELNINLNPISVSKSSITIDNFEKEYIPSQPVLLAVKSETCSLKEVHCIENVIGLLDDIIEKLPMKTQRIIDFTTLYQQTFDANISAIDQKKLSQFLLALEFVTNPDYLISKDTKETYMLFSISMQTSTDALSELIAVVDEVGKAYPDFHIRALSHLARVNNYKEMFIHETFMSMILILGILVGLFMLYYQKISIVIVFIPAFLTLSLFFVLHMLLNLPISLMSLIALVLFMGLIADNIIHVAICYKRHGALCFETVYKPIALSNILMILAFSGMMFTGSFLEQFGLELGVLLAVHLLCLVYLLPNIAGKYLKV